MKLKEECKEMDSLVGSGRIITTPIITENGEPIADSNDGGVKSGPRLDEKIIQWKLTLHQIGLDVLRTDRSLVFYEENENLSKLWDVLAVYAWMDKQVGYGQGQKKKEKKNIYQTKISN